MISWNAVIEQLKFQITAPLVFNSAFFFFFFTLFFGIYALVHKRVTLRLWIVSLFSLFFFYKACGEYVIFILAAAVVEFEPDVALVDYGLGQRAAPIAQHLLVARPAIVREEHRIAFARLDRRGDHFPVELGAVSGLDRTEGGRAVSGKVGGIGMLGIQPVLFHPGEPLALAVGDVDLRGLTG